MSLMPSEPCVFCQHIVEDLQLEIARLRAERDEAREQAVELEAGEKGNWYKSFTEQVTEVMFMYTACRDRVAKKLRVLHRALLAAKRGTR